ncbi:hypothetical protein D9613_006877 [Agrocybe pediades]|uniref:Uncharacterized protein n=1 Tax=Agrocybe pediades TaxID=84607 RepID=A0A8H4QGF0_9AGAR|nr:hypothetical protein D9613_006877 [Agrocybe pediades]
MFRTHSPYSPFFTSGLLSLDAEPDVPTSPTRRGSLPETTAAGSTREAFYFTLHSRRSDADADEYRSYLSLDLAESQSMRSASLKRKASEKSDYRPFRFPTISETVPTVPSLRLRLSRDSIRTIPSPKPAPSITLPEVPTQTRSSPSPPPRLPSLRPLPALDLSVLPKPKVSVAAPTVTRTSSSAKFQSKKNSRLSIATTSTVSTRAKRHNRSEALARLEGRRQALASPVYGAYYPKRNFMSMSDDEDDQEALNFLDEDLEVDLNEQNDDADADDESDDSDHLDDDNQTGLESYQFPAVPQLNIPLNSNPLLEPEDQVLPPSSSRYSAYYRPGFLEAPRTAPLPPKNNFFPSSPLPLPLPSPSPSSSAFLSPSSAHSLPQKTEKQSKSRTPGPASANSALAPVTNTNGANLRRQRTRRGKGMDDKEWFPLKSFIDLDTVEPYAPESKSTTREPLAKERRSKRKIPQTAPLHPYRAVASGISNTSSSSNAGSTTSVSGWSSWRSFIEVSNVA